MDPGSTASAGLGDAGPPEAAIAAELDYVPRKAADVLELDMEDGVILYDHGSSLVHHLNPSAAVVWHLCDGDASVAQLAAEVAEEYQLDRSVLEGQLTAVIGEFDALGLVQDARGDLA